MLLLKIVRVVQRFKRTSFFPLLPELLLQAASFPLIHTSVWALLLLLLIFL